MTNSWLLDTTACVDLWSDNVSMQPSTAGQVADLEVAYL